MTFRDELYRESHRPTLDGYHAYKLLQEPDLPESHLQDIIRFLEDRGYSVRYMKVAARISREIQGGVRAVDWRTVTK